MTNKELQTLLAGFPDDMTVKLMHTHEIIRVDQQRHKYHDPIEFTAENVLHTSETAYADPDAPEEEWDSEDGKVRLGDGQQYLLINPIII